MDLFDLKFGWYKKIEGLYEGLIGSSIIFGMMLGAIFSSTCMNHLGRRYALVFGSVLGSCGCLITLLTDLEVIILGRVIIGISVGITTPIAQRFTEEAVPIHLYEIYAPMNMIGFSMGEIISFSLGFILPRNSDDKALKVDTNWHYIYTWIPLILYSI